MTHFWPQVKHTQKCKIRKGNSGANNQISNLETDNDILHPKKNKMNHLQLMKSIQYCIIPVIWQKNVCKNFRVKNVYLN